MSNSSTLKLSDTLAFVRPFVNNIQLNLNNNQPFLGYCNTAAQWFMAEPLVWRFNRNVTGFVCTAGQQDYLVGNWPASTAVSAGFRIIDTNGNSQRVSIAGTTGSSQPSWNASSGGSTTDSTATWVNDGTIPLGTSTFNYGFTENFAVKDTTSAKWYQRQSKRDLSPDSSQSQPMYISDQLEDSNGNIIFRLMPVPDKAYPIQITAQKKFVPYTSLNQTWGIPDQYVVSAIQHGVLAYSYLYRGNVQGAQWANQKFIANTLGCQTGLNDTERNVWLTNYMMSTQAIMYNFNMQRGNQARGV